MRSVRYVVSGFLVFFLVLSDYVAWKEIHHSMAWVLGEGANLASVAMLVLANLVTFVFVFEGLTPSERRKLHGIAAVLYGVVMLAIYASAVEQGLQSFPAEIAQEAFRLSQPTAARLAAIAIGCALAGTSFTFWHVIGTLIHSHVSPGSVRWRDAAERSGLPVDNILNIDPARRASGD